MDNNGIYIEGIRQQQPTKPPTQPWGPFGPPGSAHGRPPHWFIHGWQQGAWGTRPPWNNGGPPPPVHGWQQTTVPGTRPVWGGPGWTMPNPYTQMYAQMYAQPYMQMYAQPYMQMYTGQPGRYYDVF